MRKKKHLSVAQETHNISQVFSFWFVIVIRCGGRRHRCCRGSCFCSVYVYFIYKQLLLVQ